jgi:hypothetical protein
MDSLDLFFKKYAYKFPKGYPDLTNEQDINLLAELLENVGVDLTEDGFSDSYNSIITKKFGSYPTPQGDYTLGTNVNLSGEDGKIFKELYPISPPKAGQEDSNVGSKGSGNGEIAMYWILSKKYNVMDGRGGGAPDLYVDKVGVEVKAYDSERMALGRFGSDEENIKLLSSIFGLYSLITTLEHKPQNKTNTLNFSSKGLIEALKEVSNFSKEEDLRKLDYPVIKNIYANIDNVLTKLDINSYDFDPVEASAKLLRKLLLTKATVKPGLGGFIVNVDVNGKIEYHQVTEDKIQSLTSDQLNSYVSANQGTLVIYPDKLF